jgi:hypothetical protein
MFICGNKNKIKVDYSSKANSYNIHYFAPPIGTVDPDLQPCVYTHTRVYTPGRTVCYTAAAVAALHPGFGIFHIVLLRRVLFSGFSRHNFA